MIASIYTLAVIVAANPARAATDESWFDQLIHRDEYVAETARTSKKMIQRKEPFDVLAAEYGM